MSDEVAGLLGKRFLERRDTKAVQFKDGHYEPDRTPFKMGDLRAHLTGERTYGHYLISAEDRCRIIAFDIDLPKSGLCQNPDGEDETVNCREAWLEPGHWARREMADMLVATALNLACRVRDLLGLDVAISYSGGKGLHVYGFTGPVPSSDAYAAAMAVVSSFKILEPFRGQVFWHYKWDEPDALNAEIEVFPKQGSLEGKDLGNLIRLPLGVNRKTGQAGFFLDVIHYAKTGEMAPADPFDVLTHGSAL